jgi:hypothetical protein
VGWEGRGFLIGLHRDTCTLVGGGFQGIWHQRRQPHPWQRHQHRNEHLRAVVSEVAKYAKAVLLVQSTGESPALDLRVGEPGSSPADKTVAPMKVNSQVEVTNLNAAFLEGNHASHVAAAYKRTVVVSPVGADTENGTALLDALSGIILGTSRAPPDSVGQCRVCALLWERWSFIRLRGRKRQFAV